MKDLIGQEEKIVTLLDLRLDFKKNKNSQSVNERILQRKKDNLLPKGRATKVQLKKMFPDIADEIKHSITFDGENIYEIGQGKKSKKALGEGRHGVVKLGQEIESERFVAIKVLNKLSLKDDRNKEIYSSFKEQASVEVNAYRELGYSSPTPVYIERKRSESTSEEIKECLMSSGELIMPLMEGMDMYDYVMTKSLTLNEKMDCALATLRAVKVLHDKGFVHGDIKPENIIYDENLKKAHMVDFTFLLKENEKVKREQYCQGTLCYYNFLAQPDAAGFFKVNKTRDLYALAVTIAFIFNPSVIAIRITDHDQSIMEKIINNITVYFRDNTDLRRAIFSLMGGEEILCKRFDCKAAVGVERCMSVDDAINKFDKIRKKISFDKTLFDFLGGEKKIIKQDEEKDKNNHAALQGEIEKLLNDEKNRMQNKIENCFISSTKHIYKKKIKLIDEFLQSAKDTWNIGALEKLQAQMTHTDIFKRNMPCFFKPQATRAGKAIQGLCDKLLKDKDKDKDKDSFILKK